jgi:hypothetical protein
VNSQTHLVSVQGCATCRGAPGVESRGASGIGVGRILNGRLGLG